ncbi:MAG TPA: hypothetical protein VJQ08_00425 [Candidatus Dormibacteraeota bacterium]|nr:hypothetical protein [Candidatus Dormibacteraeota bacterium]
MDVWVVPLSLALFVLACLALGFFAVDSRPGFTGVGTAYKERWFPHSRED